ncbi:MAG: hypothetical protein K2J00_02000 [Bacteroidaceae bacterium]|nr:hypothetical protein [Bacteroidaceae bacterium]
MKTTIYILLSVIMLLSSCGKKNFADDILKLQSRPIDLSSCEGAVCYENGERAAYDSSADSAYKLVIYIDSASCSPCFVSHMYDYEETVAELDSVGIRTVFIFEPQKEKEEDVKTLLDRQAYPFLSVVVRNGSFSSANPHLPSSSLLHSFLLNKENKVIVVGNPARNDKVKELMLNTVKTQGGQ